MALGLSNSIGRLGLQSRKGLGIISTPTAFTSIFTVDTITGTLAWTDNSGGLAAYEVYSNTNGAGDVLLTTTAVGATSYSDTGCKQNASVVYKVRGKRGSIYSEYATATALVTPLCWKTNQSTLTTVTLSYLTVNAGGTVTITWGDGTSNAYTGASTAITKNYSTTGIYNISISGDLNKIFRLTHIAQVKSYGNLTNWIIPSESTIIQIRGNSFTGCIPNIPDSSLAFAYEVYANSFSSACITTFRKAATIINIGTQNVAFTTVEVDKFYKNAADWYQVNAPTANCTFTSNGANMGIPTGGASNVDIVRLAQYYTNAGKTATIVISS